MRSKRNKFIDKIVYYDLQWYYRFYWSSIDPDRLFSEYRTIDPGKRKTILCNEWDRCCAGLLCILSYQLLAFCNIRGNLDIGLSLWVDESHENKDDVKFLNAFIMTTTPDSLTNRQKNICEYGGGFGAVLTLVCLIQHLIFAIPNKITNPMIPMYIFIIIAFILLAIQKQIALILLIIGAALTSIIEYLWMTHYSFSLVVLLLFLYNVLIIITVFSERIPQTLKQIQQTRQAEDNFWREKL